MKKIILICLIFIPTIIFSQKPEIFNIKLDIKNTDVIISYDLVNAQDTTEEIDLILIDNSKNVYIPDNITGNIGTNLKYGKNSLSFNMLDQEFPLDRMLTPKLILDHNLKIGPKAALLSVLIPGLGDYYVESSKNIRIKPYYRTATVAGFLALAIIANQKLEEPESYNVQVWIPSTTTWWGRKIPGYYETQTFKTNPKDYWLFKNDIAIFIGAAASVWIFDIFWVLNKGQQNQKIRKAIKNKNYNFSLSGGSFSVQVNLN